MHRSYTSHSVSVSNEYLQVKFNTYQSSEYWVSDRTRSTCEISYLHTFPFWGTKPWVPTSIGLIAILSQRLDEMF